MITFKPFLGLANRMRAINSAVALSRYLKTQIRVIWVKDFKLNAKFTDLFKIPEDDSLKISQPHFKIYSLPFTIRFPKYMNIVKFLASMNYDISLILNKIEHPKIDFESLDNNKKIFIAAYYEFYKTEFDASLFNPVDNIMNEINKVSNNFNNSTYGIHIRRGDNQESRMNSPTKLFELKIDELIMNDNNSRFYLATDSIEDKNKLLEKYGDRIITQFFETKRTKVKGIQNAVIDMYLLSRTKMILGSFWSSFTDVASMLGKVPLEIIKNND